jgi:hypothetical protein
MRPTGLLLHQRRRSLRYEFYNGLHSFPSRGRRTVCGKSLDHRHHGYAGDLYGTARHEICECFLPHIAGGLAVSYDESTWVLTSYLVSNAVVLPLSAWLSRVFGRKRYYMLCVVLFTLSSLLCGFAPLLGLLIFFRVLQGVGGGGLAPVEQAILVDTFPPAKRPANSAVRIGSKSVSSRSDLFLEG